VLLFQGSGCAGRIREMRMRRCQKGELFISCASAACVGATRKIVYLTKQIKIFLAAPTQAAEAHERGHSYGLGILLWPGVHIWPEQNTQPIRVPPFLYARTHFHFTSPRGSNHGAAVAGPVAGQDRADHQRGHEEPAPPPRQRLDPEQQRVQRARRKSWGWDPNPWVRGFPGQ